MNTYTFPPFNLVGLVLAQMRQHLCTILVIAPLWPRRPWFPQLLDLVFDVPQSIPPRQNLLRQPRSLQIYQGPERLHLHAWMLSGDSLLREAFLWRLQQASPDRYGLPHLPYMTPNGCIFCSWCVRRQADSVSAPIHLIVEFLLHLFGDKKLSPGTIRGYLTASANVLSCYG